MLNKEEKLLLNASALFMNSITSIQYQICIEIHLANAAGSHVVGTAFFT